MGKRKQSLNSANRKRRLFNLRLRDGDRCHICGELMKFKIRTHPRSATVDHIIPVCCGGLNTLDNLKLAHRACNQQRASDMGLDRVSITLLDHGELALA